MSTSSNEGAWDHKQAETLDHERPHVVQKGVVKIAAATRVWTPVSKACLFVGIAAVSYVYSLDGTTTYLYLPYATSSFSQHSLLSTISVVQAILLAVMKPPAAKVADVFGRAEAYLFAVVLYTVGYIVVAACKNVNTYAAGIAIYAAGQASLQILQQIVIADVTTMRWRGLVSQLVSLPFFINAFVAPNIGAGVLATSNWHWGYAMFAILVPVCTAPIFMTLLWAQHKARRRGVVATNYTGAGADAVISDHRPFFRRFLSGFGDLDLIGLLLFAAGWSCLLLPLTLVNRAENTWQSPKMIALITVGCVLLVVFVLYEGFVARLPIVPFRFFKNRTFVCACIIAFIDFVSFYLQYTYQYSFIAVTHSTWGFKYQGFFAFTQTLSLTLFAIIAGLIQLRFGRLKWMLVGGLCIRMLGVGVMIYTKGAHGSTAGLVLTQIVQGAGGGIAACATQVAAQASVSHQDVAGATAVYLLFAEIGGAIGTAIAGAIWKGYMPEALKQQLSPYANQTTIDGIFGSITTAASYPRTDPIYIGTVIAYDGVMKRLLIAATVLAAVPIIASLFVEDIKLTSAQNAVEDGDVIEELDEKKISVAN